MQRFILILFLVCMLFAKSEACSIVYFVDSTTGKIYVANHEDYYYDVKDYIQIMPARKNKNARLWYGWNNFSHGGVNDKGLFFDGAVTPKQEIPTGYQGPNGRNIGDELLANCNTTQEAVAYLEKEKIAIGSGHMLLGDAKGHAVILEWVGGERKIVPMKTNALIATNFLYSDTTAGNFPCFRHYFIAERIKKLTASKKPIDLSNFGKVMEASSQAPQKDQNGRTGGTLYTSFICLSDMEFVLVPKLDRSKAIQLDLKKEFALKKKRKIKF